MDRGGTQNRRPTQMEGGWLSTAIKACMSEDCQYNVLSTMVDLPRHTHYKWMAVNPRAFSLRHHMDTGSHANLKKSLKNQGNGSGTQTRRPTQIGAGWLSTASKKNHPAIKACMIEDCQSDGLSPRVDMFGL